MSKQADEKFPPRVWIVFKRWNEEVFLSKPPAADSVAKRNTYSYISAEEHESITADLRAKFDILERTNTALNSNLKFEINQHLNTDKDLRAKLEKARAALMQIHAYDFKNDFERASDFAHDSAKGIDCEL